jgi:hypothetical protein
VVIPAKLLFDVEMSRKSDLVQQPFTVTVLPEVGRPQARGVHVAPIS